MNRAFRKLTLTAHLVSSLGWLGAVGVFLALAVVALVSVDPTMVRGAYLLMLPAAWFVLVPLAHMSLLSGIALSLGSAWGLFRHYWVATKLILTAVATAVLIVYMGTFRQMAGVAENPALGLGVVRNVSPVVHSVLALVALSISTWLGIYKPFGPTPYGDRLIRRSPAASTGVEWSLATVSERSVVFLALAAIATILALVALHRTGPGFHHH